MRKTSFVLLFLCLTTHFLHAQDSAALPVSSRMLLNEFNMSIKHGNLLQTEPTTTAATTLLPFVFDTSINASPQKGDISNMIISSDGMLMALSGATKNIYLMDPDTKKITSTLSRHTAKVEGMAFSHDGSMLVSCSRDKTVKIWNTHTNEMLSNMVLEGVPLICFFNANDQEVIIGTEEGKILEYDTKGKELKNVSAHEGKVMAMALSSSGDLVSAGLDLKLKVWNIQKMSKPVTYELKANHIVEAVFSHTGALICIDEKGNCMLRGQSPYSDETAITALQSLKPNATALYDDANLMLKSASGTGINIFDLNEKKVSLMDNTKGKNIHAMAVDPLRRCIMYSDNAGKLTFCYLLGKKRSASEIVKEIEKDPALAGNLKSSKDALAAALESYAQEVMTSILESNGKYPSVKKCQSAVEAINSAIALAGVTDARRAKKLFLEGYDIILRNDRPQYEEAKKKFKEISGLEPNAKYPYIGISAIELQLNDRNALYATAVRMNEIDRKWGEPFRLLGLIHMESGHYDSAEQVYQEFINLAPESSKGYVLLGIEKQKLGAFSAAATAYQTAFLNSDHEDPAILANYASLQLRRGSSEDALTLLSSAIAADSSYQVSYQLLGDYYAREYNSTGMDSLHKLSRIYYQDAVALSPYDPASYVTLGNFYIHENIKQKEEGEPIVSRITGDSIAKIFEKALDLNPYAEDAYAGLGWCEYLYKSSIGGAVRKMNEAISKKPESANAYYNLASFYSEVNDTTNAINALKTAIEKDKKSQHAYTKLMSIYEKLNQPANFTKVYDQAAAQLPSSPVLPYTAARFEYKLGNFAKAEHLLKKALELDKGFVSAKVIYNDLATNPKALNLHYKEYPLNSNYDHIDTLQDSTYLVCKDKMYYIASPDMHIIRKLNIYDKIKEKEGHGSYTTTRGGKFGWMNEKLEEIVPAKYEEIQEGRTMVFFKDKGKWGAYSIVKGEGIIVPAEYDSTQEAEAKVSSNTEEKKKDE